MAALDRLAERELGAMEALFVMGDSEVHSRSTIVMLVRLASPPEYEDVVRAHERATRLVPHLRRRVVHPVVPVSRPYWAIDPDFDVRYHVRRVRVPGDGNEADLMELVESLGHVPIDVARPLWECTVVEGLADGTGALLYKLHHAISDGQGVKGIWNSVFTEDSLPVPLDLPPLPPAEDVSRLDVTRQRLGQLPFELVAGGVGALPGGVRAVLGVLRHPRQRLSSTSTYVASLRRTLGSAPTENSPLLQRRGIRRRFATLSLPFADLRAASKALHVSINSAYVAAVLGGLARYHEAQGQPVPEIVVAMPVSVRRPEDRHEENRFVGVRFAGPLCGHDLPERAQLISTRVRAAREEPALEAFLALGPVLSRVPMWLTAELVSGGALTSDLQISNIPGWLHRTYLGGIEVEGFYGFAPLAGAALMVTMATHQERCDIGVNMDLDAVTDPDLLRRCLDEAFAELLDLAAPLKVAT